MSDYKETKLTATTLISVKELLDKDGVEKTDDGLYRLRDVIQSNLYKEDELFRASFNSSLYDYYALEKVDGIYGYMYGVPCFMECNLRTGEETVKPDKLMHIEKSSLELVTHESGYPLGFLYIWGYPGPDYNKYMFRDYGITWAFSEKDIRKMTYEEWEEYRNQQEAEQI